MEEGSFKRLVQTGPGGEMTAGLERKLCWSDKDLDFLPMWTERTSLPRLGLARLGLSRVGLAVSEPLEEELSDWQERGLEANWVMIFLRGSGKEDGLVGLVTALEDGDCPPMLKVVLAGVVDGQRPPLLLMLLLLLLPRWASPFSRFTVPMTGARDEGLVAEGFSCLGRQGDDGKMVWEVM
jgi:hypothetical protein